VFRSGSPEPKGDEDGDEKKHHEEKACLRVEGQKEIDRKKIDQNDSEEDAEGHA
jgi:hypothetical protein